MKIINKMDKCLEVSIITPLYNSVDFLLDTYESVLSQTFQNWEWIIIDDHSSDGSYEMAVNFSKNDNRIVVLKTLINSGTAAARNMGLRHSKGRYITFLDSDDTLDNEYLEKQLKFIANNGPIISAGYRRKTLKSCTDFFVPCLVDYKTALKGNPLSCLTTMYDKSIIGDVYFPENIEKPEDYVFWLNILKTGYVVKGNPTVLATYNIHKSSKSFNKIKLIGRMHYVYHKTQGLGWLRSWFYVFRWAIYGIKKYRKVK